MAYMQLFLKSSFLLSNLDLTFQTDIYEVCPTPLVLAQQMTHIELERLSMIGAEEFVQAFVKEKVNSKKRPCTSNKHIDCAHKNHL